MSQKLDNVVKVINEITECGFLQVFKDYEVFLREVLNTIPNIQEKVSLPEDAPQELLEKEKVFMDMIPDLISKILDIFKKYNVTKESIRLMSEDLDGDSPYHIYKYQIGGNVKTLFAIFRNFLEKDTKRNTMHHQNLFYRHCETKGLPALINQILGYIKSREMEMSEVAFK